MKKRLVAILTAAVMMMCAVPVFATEADQEVTDPDQTVTDADQQLSNVEPAGSTAVEADILGEDTGEVSYIIAIPERIDFGTLQMPADNSVAHPKQVGFEVSAVEINGLDTSTSRVAVLMKDSSAAAGVFQITGTSGTNMNKVLTYSVLTSVGTDITAGTEYTNGYVFAAFATTGQSLTGTLSLDQNQLLDDTEIANWAGDYQGTINFYTAIASLNSYN